MKPILTFCAALLLCSLTSSAQLFKIGAKAGASMNKITGQSFSEKFVYGYHVGGYIEIGLGKKFSIQPEVLFNQVNTDTSSKFSSIYAFNNVSDIQLKYLSIPVILNYKLTNLLSLQAGPQFGILIDEQENLLQNGKEAFKKGDFSMLGGLQLSLMKFKLYGRYVVGLNNLDNIGDKDKWKSQSIQFGLGIGL